MNAIPELAAFVRGYATPRIATFLLLPDFSQIGLATVSDILISVNRICNTEFYASRLLALDQKSVVASDGTRFEVESVLSEQDLLDLPGLIILCGDSGSLPEGHPLLCAWLDVALKHHVPVISIGSASAALAATGALDGRRAAIYWEDLPRFTEKYPNVDARSALYEKDGTIYTTPGGVAVLDTMLRYVQDFHYAGLVSQICDVCLTDRVRDAGERQRRRGRREPDLQSKTILAIIDLMEDNIVQPLTSTAIAQKIGRSRRQIERLFGHYLGCSPNRYYLELRLAYARRLIQTTDRPIADIANAHGFRSPAHFAKRYREVFGTSPIHERRRAITLEAV